MIPRSKNVLSARPRKTKTSMDILQAFSNELDMEKPVPKGLIVPSKKFLPLKQAGAGQ